jgi:hypothetical protein
MKTFLLPSLAILASAAPSFGAVVFNTNAELGPGGVGSTFTPSYAVSSTDLINGLTPSAFAGDFAAVELSGGLPVLTDGAYGTITEPGGAPDRTHGAFGLGGGGSGTGTSATYSLTANPLGYNISSVAVYGGWNDNGRDQQLYTFSYSVVGDPSFITLPITVSFDSGAPGGFQIANRTILTEDALPFLAMNVDAVRFDFPPGVENQYTGYAELDVIGLAVVPEPGSMLLAGAGLAGLMLRRRRQA